MSAGTHRFKHLSRPKKESERFVTTVARDAWVGKNAAWLAYLSSCTVAKRSLLMHALNRAQP